MVDPISTARQMKKRGASERDKSEQRLQEIEERFNALITASAQIVWTASHTGEILEDSPSWRAFTGQTYEQWRGWGWVNALHPDDRKHTTEAWTRAVESHSIYEVEYRLHHASGTWRWTHARGAPLRNPDGSIRGWVGINTDITERKEAEEELRKSEERFQLASRGTEDAIHDWDLLTNDLEWNVAFHTVFHHSKELLKSKITSWYDNIHPEDKERVKEGAFLAINTGKERWLDEYRFSDGTGFYRYVIDRGYIVRDKNGIPVRMIGAIQDITGRKMAELALAQSQKELKTLANFIPQLTWMADQFGSIFWFNQRWYDYTGTRIEEMRGWGWKQVHHPEHVERVMKRISHSFKTGEPWEDTFPLRSKTGEWRWFLSRALPLFDSEGKIFRWFGTCTDITEHLQIEEALRHANAEAERSAKRLHDLQVITEAALSRTKSLDTLLESTVNYIQETLPSDSASIFLLNEDKQTLSLRTTQGLKIDESTIPKKHTLVGKVLETEKSVTIQEISQSEFENTNLREKRIRRLMAVPLRTKKQTIGVLRTARITGPEYTQDELTLFQLIADRVANAIDNANLYNQTQINLKKLIEERELRERFVAALSHDLRTPIVSARMSAQLLSTKVEKPNIKKITENILKGIDRIDRMIQDLLDANRITAGERLPIQCKMCSVSTVLCETLSDLKQIHGDRFEWIDEIKDVQGYFDSQALRRMLENLCNNAVKYGSINRPIAVRVQLIEKNQLEISVHNEGEPISDEDKATLFDLFKRTKVAEVSGKKGWGIGLTLVRGVVEAHDGKVTVVSSKEEGTTFIARLPLDMRKAS